MPSKHIVLLHVDGMVCFRCADEVKCALQAVPGVDSSSVKVDLLHDSAYVEALGTTTTKELVQAIKKAKFEAKVVEDKPMKPAL